MLELFGKSFKSLLFKKAPSIDHKHYWFKGKINGLSQETHDIKKSQMEILELKNTITKIKSSLMGSIAEWT